jgi:hypothetical protein
MAPGNSSPGPQPSGVDGFEHLRRDPKLARIFDDAMTNMSQLTGPAIAAKFSKNRT